MSQKLRVLVLFGGRSAEHEISVLSARFIAESLDRERFEPTFVAIGKSGQWHVAEEAALLNQAADPRLVKLAASTVKATLGPYPEADLARLEVGAVKGPIDVVFPVLHGPMGEDGTIQGLLTLSGAAFVGAGVLGSAVGMDKDVMKRLLRERGLPIVPYVTIRKHEWTTHRLAALGRAAALGDTVFVKPANLGSSVGISRVRGGVGLDRAIDEAFTFDRKVVVEKALLGVRELECGVLGGDEPIASSVGEIEVTHPDGFYSYDAKYVDESGSTVHLPAQISPADTATIQALAKQTFEALECEGLARVDFFQSESGELYVNEINTMPGFTAISMYPKLFEHAGIGAKALVGRLIDLAVARKKEQDALRTSKG